MVTREQTRQNYDRMSRWYDLFAASEVKFTQAGLDLLSVKAGERVLEIGFGTGHSLLDLAKAVGESGSVTGVELSPGMIAVARKRLYSFEHKQAEDQDRSVGIVQGDATSLPIGSKSFPAVFLSFTLELFSEQEMQEVLKECQRILQLDGRICVVSMAKKDVLACRMYEWGHQRWPVLLDCRPIELSKSLEASGFRVQAAKIRTMWGLPVEIALAKIL